MTYVITKHGMYLQDVTTRRFGIKSTALKFLTMEEAVTILCTLQERILDSSVVQYKEFADWQYEYYLQCVKEDAVDLNEHESVHDKAMREIDWRAKDPQAFKAGWDCAKEVK